MTDPLQPCINELLRLNALLLKHSSDRTESLRILSEIERLCVYYKTRLTTRTVIDTDGVVDEEL